MLFQMMLLLAQRVWAKVMPRRKQAVYFKVDGKQFSDVCLFKVSKPGHVVLVGRLGGRRVKIYQVFSPAHADFVRRVCTLPDVREYFPRVLHKNDRHIVVEWVEGKPLTVSALVTKHELLERFADIQAALHQQRLDDQEPGFDYVSFLEARLHRFRSILPLSPGLRWILDRVHDVPGPLSPRVSHPDFTPSNVVIEKASGQLKIIDNEALTQSSAYLIDLFITYHSLRNPVGLGERYIALQRRHVSDLELPVGWASYLLALWGLRLTGAMFQAGQFAGAYHLADRMARGEFDEHPVVRMIRERESV